MGLFNKDKNKVQSQSNTTIILAPCDGEIVALEEVPDQAFAEKMVGDGVAILPSGDTLVAPCDGRLGTVYKTNHAFSIETRGIELFVHFGVDTVDLKGKGFTRLLEDGTEVKAGTPVLKFDLDFLKKNAQSILTPVVISNPEEFKSIEYSTDKRSVIRGSSPIITIVHK